MGQAIHSRLRGEYPVAETSHENEKTTEGTPWDECQEKTEKEMIYR